MTAAKTLHDKKDTDATLLAWLVRLKFERIDFENKGVVDSLNHANIELINSLFCAAAYVISLPDLLIAN